MSRMSCFNCDRECYCGQEAGKKEGLCIRWRPDAVAAKKIKYTKAQNEGITDWIYYPIIPEEETLFEKIEKALGFKLFIWQKIFLLQGYFRCFGETTAKCLRKLLFEGDEPLDLSGPKTHRERIECEILQNIKKKLEEAGIKTRTVYFTKEDKRRDKNYERLENGIDCNCRDYASMYGGNFWDPGKPE